MMAWRYIENGPQSGSFNMAFDMAMLKYALHHSQPVLRFYQWQPYCISLGYHQSVQSIDLKKCADHQVDVVRRPTGGRAVLHAEEVTYCVVIPNNCPFYSSSIQESYKLISRALARGVSKLGIAADLKKQSLDMRAHYQKKESLSCFSAVSRSEIMIDTRKLIGSAQRQLPEGLLQHGSILLGNKHLDLPFYYVNMSESEKEDMVARLAKKTISLNSVFDHPISYDDACEVLKMGFEDTFSVHFEEKGALVEMDESDKVKWNILQN